MYMQVNKLRVLQSVALMCDEIGGQVVYVINMPWYKLFIPDVPIQNGYTDYTEITKCTGSGADLTCAVNTYSPKGGTCSALRLVKTHRNP